MASTSNSNGVVPSSVTDAVLKPSDAMPAGAQKVEELDFNAFAGRSITVEELIDGTKNMGFQASSIGQAVKIINDMVCLLQSLVATVAHFVLARMERSRDGGQDHYLSRLYFKSYIVWSSWYTSLFGTAQSRVSYSYHSWWN